MLTTALKEGPGCHQCLKDRKMKRTWDLELHFGESKGNQKQKWEGVGVGGAGDYRKDV